jgi:hypothetical protein
LPVYFSKKRRIDLMPACIIPGCPREASNNLSVRLRRADTSAIWAPNTDAYVCDTHATQGARLTLFYESVDSGSVEINVHGAAPAASRTTPIRKGREELPETLVQEVKELRQAERAQGREHERDP